jgi:hypothetical protein
MLYPGMESGGAENGPGTLTQRNIVSRLGLLHLVLACGNLLNTLHCREAERGGNSAFNNRE